MNESRCWMTGRWQLSGRSLAAFLLWGPLLLGAPTGAGAEEVSRPVPIIFDTDIGNDVDDVLALGMIHALESRGECELLAVTITKDHPLAAPFTDAVNTFYGQGDIPIGVTRSGVTAQKGKFVGLAEQKDGGRPRYAHDLASGKSAPDAVKVLRESLGGADDHSVVIIQVGFSTNLAELLESKPDDASPLGGAELVKKKVRLLSIMAGAFGEIPGMEGKFATYKEYNVFKDVPSARKLARDWPTPIVWSGFEIGRALPYPHESIAKDYDYVEHHPLAESYVLYTKPGHDRPTWDLTSVLYAVRPGDGYFDLSAPGIVRVTEEGITQFEESSGGKHRYLVVKDQQRPRTLEALIQLSSQPPVRQASPKGSKQSN
ncbi:nucleoside hydrolase [Kolteria novifilia]|uniref:nucleoside hydrolase n=1 Tax=Kolteria novifilia TaxID=2527975 RepID=UPI003AF39929